ncbi:ABC transporter ATP-binding protein/permease [Gordonia sp. Z-3]|uniref:ABC transporter ATP-binding protein/permease n=2 Tax=Gordonia TaxID=2053 RepID=A0A9X3D350_9ACTN|nr:MULTISPECIES: ABC transporter ATP-binding protein/permease [Gordonia]MCF3938404.1 ABC transporter ATP-binding protein/permease [Gordonia tangerina]MCX2963951.1 ABC transporter ATP-binding protein/permease [Gordonia aquimaris]MED5801645.1 ABC transporter ATP-binding protein/permease [Gordonia sp. Z-3]
MDESIDWSHEWLASTIWLAIAFAISAAAGIAICAALARYTKWGRQFWRLSRGFFTGPGKWLTWTILAGLLLLTLLSVRLNVLISYQYNDMYTAMQGIAEGLVQGDLAARDSAASAFWRAIGIFGLLATLHVIRSLVDFYAGQAFDIRWRTWMTDRMTADWLDGQAYYRNRFVGEANIDNPDQRIEADITNFVTYSRGLAFGAVSAVVSIVSFTKILWDLSGPLTILGVTFPRAMMWIVLSYVLVTTVIAFYIGRPLIRLNFLNERLTANFRYALVRIRDGAENVAFYRGEGVERAGLLSRFAEVIRNFWRIVFRTLKFNGWNLTVNQTAVVFPLIVQAPRFIAGEITLGAVMQSSTAFGNMHDSLSFFRESYDEFTELRASLIRLDGLHDANNKSRELRRIPTEESQERRLALQNVDITTPDDRPLVRSLSLSMTPGDALVVKGSSGSGKTTLLRGIAEMWPFVDGEVDRPLGRRTLFLSQIPYIPLGDLRTAVAYPAAPDDVGDDAIRSALQRVFLPHLVDRLDEEEDWSKVLSPGEQQRVAFARILLTRPEVVFMDEATSAVDEGLEYSLYSLIRAELPETILVSVSHRSTTDQHHTEVLELTGGGEWELRPVTT